MIKRFQFNDKIDIAVVAACIVLGAIAAWYFSNSFWNECPFNSDETFRELNDPYFNAEIVRLQNIYTVPVFVLSAMICTGTYLCLRQFNGSAYWHLLFGVFCWPIIVFIFPLPLLLIAVFLILGVVSALICMVYSLCRKEFGKKLVFALWAGMNNLALGVFIFFFVVDLFNGLIAD